MQLSEDILRDMELLNLFNLQSTNAEGLKIHHDADPARIASAQRLHRLNMISLSDGGYLTPLGVEAAEHADALVRLLRT